MKLKTINKWIEINKFMEPTELSYYFLFGSFGVSALASDLHLENFCIFCSAVFTFEFFYILTWLIFSVFFLLMRKRYYKKRNKLIRERSICNEN